MSYFAAPDSTSTPRFTVRSWMPGDGPALYEAVEASRTHLEPWMPWVDTHASPEHSEHLVRQFRGQYLLATNFVLGVFAPDGSVLGGTGFHLREGPLSHRQAEIGMWIRGERAQAGVGTAVLKELVHWGFTDWPWLRLVWRCSEANLASERVAEKAGFTLEGRTRGEHDLISGARRNGRVYSILRSEWSP